MAVTSGFFNSMNHDRVYSATDMGHIFEGIISDGVFAGVGNAFAASGNGGMSIIVAPGRGWFDYTWINNDANIVLPVSAATASSDRTDYLIVEVDKNDSVRADSLKVVKGPSSGKFNPTRTDVLKQYVLAEIKVKAGTSVIASNDITMVIGNGASENAAWAKPITSDLDMTQLMAKYDAQFMEWWNQLQHDMGTDVASGLQSQISQLRTDLTTETNNRIAEIEGLVGSLTPLYKTATITKKYTVGAKAGSQVQFTHSTPDGYDTVGVLSINTGNGNVYTSTYEAYKSSGYMYVTNNSSSSITATASMKVLMIRNMSSVVLNESTIEDTYGGD